METYYINKGISDEKIMKLRFVCYQAGFTNYLGKWVEKDYDLSIGKIANILKE